MKFLTPFTCNLFSLYLVAEHEDDWAAAFYFTLRSASVPACQVIRTFTIQIRIVETCRRAVAVQRLSARQSR